MAFKQTCLCVITSVFKHITAVYSNRLFFCVDSYLENNNIQVVEASAFYKMYKIHTMWANPYVS